MYSIEHPIFGGVLDTVHALCPHADNKPQVPMLVPSPLHSPDLKEMKKSKGRVSLHAHQVFYVTIWWMQSIK